MPATSSGTLSIAAFEVPGLPLPVRLQPMRQARRLRLRIDHDKGELRLTLPWRYPKGKALQWVGEQSGWIERQMKRAPVSRPFLPDATIPFRGGALVLEHAEGRRREVRHEGERLIVGGPRESFGRAVERWLRAHALDVLSDLTREIAAEAGIAVARVAVGDPVSRWGSCSSDGSIRYNWRLILAPREALRFVVAHEVAHRLHMDHSPAFKAAEARLFGGPTAMARGALRAVGADLRGVGRGV